MGHRAIMSAATLVAAIAATTVRGETITQASGPIVIPQLGSADPYPVTLNFGFANPSDVITSMSISLTGLSHTWAGDVDIMLVSPTNRKFLFMSDAFENPILSPVDLFDLEISDSAADFMPAEGDLFNGAFKPTNHDGGDLDLFPSLPPGPVFSPGPTGTHTFGSVFNGSVGTGAWRMFVRDDTQDLDGSIQSIALTITTSSVTPTNALLDNRAPTSTPTNADYVTDASTTTVNGPARINSLTINSGHMVSIDGSINPAEPSPFPLLFVDSGNVTAPGSQPAVIGTNANVGTLVLNSGGTFNVASSLRIDCYIGNQNGNTGEIFKTGPGTLELSKQNQYSLPVHIRNGTIKLSGNGTLPNAQPIDLGDAVNQTDGTLDLNGVNHLFSSDITALTPNSALVNNNAGTTSEVNVGNAAGQTTLGASLQGNILLRTSNNVVISGSNNTYTGGTSVSGINGGVLTVAADHALGTGTIETDLFNETRIVCDAPQSAITLTNSLNMLTSGGGLRVVKIDALGTKSATFTGNVFGFAKLSRGSIPNSSQSLVTFAGSASGFQGEIEVVDGALGFGDASTLPNASIYLGQSDGTGTPNNAVLLAKGTIDRPLTGANAILFNNNGRSGFAALGGPLEILFPSSPLPYSPIVWGQGGFVRDGAALLLGSTHADNIVTFRNNIDLGTTNVGNTLREICVIDNPNSPNDYAFMATQFTGNLGIRKTGNGELRLGIHGSNFHTGGTVVSEGTLSFIFSTAFGAAGTPIHLSGGTLSMDAFEFDSLFQGKPLGKGKLQHDALITGIGRIRESTADSMGAIERAVPGDQARFVLEGPGVLTVDRVRLAELNGPQNFEQGILDINAGTIAIAAGHSDAQTSLISRLHLNSPGSSTLDLNDQDMIFKNNVTSYVDVRSFIALGYNEGTWTGAGITSSAARTVAANPSITHKTSLGYADKFRAGLGGTFNGIPIFGFDVVVKYTLAGDATLDGIVSFDDLLALSQNYEAPAGLLGWWQGDFDYDGAVNFDDLLILAQNYGQSAIVTDSFERDWALALSIAPEPATLGLSVAALVMTRRRRK